MNRHEPKPKAREVAVFKSNRSQAIRIPKAFAFPENVKKVSITPVDGGLLIEPVRDLAKAWREYFEHGPFLDEDFAADIPDSPPDDVSLDD